MFEGKVIAVVIPCYKVHPYIRNVIADVPAFVDLIIAVNDCSPDSTGSELESIECSRLQILHLQQNLGVGGAMVAGFAKALEAGANIVVKMDGDGQMKGEHMKKIVGPIARSYADYAKGNRFLHSHQLKSMPIARLFGNITLTFLTKMASGYWHVFDPQNGYVAISGLYLSKLNFQKLASRRYFFENEMLIQLNIQNARVLDVPLPSVYGDEISSLKISRVITYFPYFLTQGFLHRLYQRHILRDFSIAVPLYLIGSVMFCWGFGFGLFTWIRSINSGIPATTGTVMLSVLPLLLGIQMLLQGLLIEVLQSPRAEVPPEL